jgi:chitinase
MSNIALSDSSMIHLHTFLLLIVTLASAFEAPAQRKEVIGYYPSWKWKSRNNLVSPANVPYDKLTVINYAFFAPLPDASLVGRDTVGDRIYLRCAPGRRLTDLAHQHGVKVLLSLGGWEDSNNFPAVAATFSLRAAFAHSCVAAIAEFDFDGIDIDWEYPGYADHKGTPNDKHNFTLLLRTLRDSLDAHEKTTGKYCLLTAALPAGASMVANIELDTVSLLLDQLNLMTYDFHGPWDRLSNHNSPLYSSVGADSARCVDAVFKLYNKVYGIPSSKINLGVPFYGHTFSQCTAINSPHGGRDTVHFSPSGAFYYDIVGQSEAFTRHWDSQAKVPYLISNRWNLLVSYDDEESIRAKAQYVLDNHASGVIIWEITGDYFEDGTTPLLDTIHSLFNSSKKKTR